MKKGNKKILVVALLILLITVTFTTYAIYKNSYSGNGSVTAAKWNVSLTNGASPLSQTFTLTFEGTDCQNEHVADGVIAPGAKCTKTIGIDAADTQVDVLIAGGLTEGASITTSKGTLTGANPFTVTATVDGDDVTTVNGGYVIAHNATDKTATVTVEIAWDGEESDSLDPNDTALNEATLTVPITLTAKQYLGSN